MYFYHNQFPLPSDCFQTPASHHPILSELDIPTPPLLICVGLQINMLMDMGSSTRVDLPGATHSKKIGALLLKYQLSVAPLLTPHPTVPQC